MSDVRLADNSAPLVKLWEQKPTQTVEEPTPAALPERVEDLAETNRLLRELIAAVLDIGTLQASPKPSSSSVPALQYQKMARHWLAQTLADAGGEGMTWDEIAERGAARELSEATLRRVRLDVAEHQRVTKGGKVSTRWFLLNNF